MTTPPYVTSYEPSRKMDGTGFYVGTCSCGYRSAPTSVGQAQARARFHHEAKHSHGNAEACRLSPDGRCTRPGHRHDLTATEAVTPNDQAGES